MADYILSCCSTVDLSRDHLKKRDIRYACYSFELDGVSYPDDLGVTISYEKFYKAMENGSNTKTSQINISEYITYFEKLLKEGKDILHIAFSSGLSGSYNSAINAVDLIKDKYPGRRVIVIDSLAASSGYGLLVDKAADLRDKGMSIDDLAKWVEDNKLKLHHWFFSTTLKYYIKGGRVSKPAGFVGEILGICPLLNVSNEGKLVAREKIRSKKKVKEAIVNKMIEHAQNGEKYSEKCFISNSWCHEDAVDVAKAVEKAFPNMKGKVLINDIGTVIGSHAGPGTVALFFWGDERVD